MELATCSVCPRGCKLAEGAWGFCDVRAGHHGSIQDMYHSAIAWPGIQIRRWNEDIPWRFAGMRNKRVAEVYLPGCNLKCEFCIASFLINLDEIRGIQWIEPTDLVRRIAGSADVIGIVGGEPSIHVEYVADVFSQCQDRGIHTYIETNGYMTRSSAEKIAKYADHVVIGLKASLDPAYYKQKLGVIETQPIRDAVKVFVESSCEVMLTNLTDPNLWDDTQAFASLTNWIVSDVGSETRMVLGPLERGTISPPWTDERIHVTPRQPRQAHLEGYRNIATGAGLQQVFCIFVSPRTGQPLTTPEPIAAGHD